MPELARAVSQKTVPSPWTNVVIMAARPVTCQCGRLHGGISVGGVRFAFRSSGDALSLSPRSESSTRFFSGRHSDDAEAPRAAGNGTGKWIPANPGRAARLGTGPGTSDVQIASPLSVTRRSMGRRNLVGERRIHSFTDRPLCWRGRAEVGGVIRSVRSSEFLVEQGEMPGEAFRNASIMPSLTQGLLRRRCSIRSLHE